MLVYSESLHTSSGVKVSALRDSLGQLVGDPKSGTDNHFSEVIARITPTIKGGTERILLML